jgi:glycolate oxidase iron-sulfur subunit
MRNKETEEAIENIIKACIHCGMCLPACPTYLTTGNEGNSPRGRIYLINDLIKQKNFDKTDFKDTTEYLDNCLSCYACETVCPSNVNYSEILHYARKDLGASNYRKGLFGFIRFLSFKIMLNNRNILLFMKYFLKNFSWLIELICLFSKKSKLLKNLSKNLDNEYKKIETNHIYHSDIYLKNMNVEARIVSLPLGCVIDTLFNSVHWDTIFVLNKFGYHVYIPRTKCCGSLASHSGEFELGKQQVNETLNKFVEDKYPVVINSAGCGAFLQEHNKTNLQIMDLITALKSSPNNPLEGFTSNINEELNINYHPACHLNHRQGIAYDYIDILKKIPSLKINLIESADICCGSAGFYNLIKPELAYDIGQAKINNIKKNKSKLVATANPGCISQIKSLLPDDYNVVHPISIIADYLRLIHS